MSEAASQWVSVGEAAGVSGVSERTIWRYVRDGIVESRQEKRGQQTTRLINRESLPEEPVQSVSEAVRGPASEGGSGCPDMTEVGGASQRLNGSSHEVECACCKVREEQVSHLHSQLDARTEAEQQLRAMMMHLERTNAQLTDALLTKALPAHNDVDPPRRVRWWALWGRRS